MANQYRARVYIRGTSEPFPHSANTQGEGHISIQREKKHYTVMPLRVIGVSLFPVWKWNRGQVLFKAI
jgi:hypothetical protein